MLRIGLAPCSPFSVSGPLMRESARLGRSHFKVGLQTHLSETADEHRYCVDLPALVRRHNAASQRELNA